jgi:hypothetical protein
MIEPQSMNTFTYVTSTIGGGIAVRDLVDKVKMMRRYRGQVSPIVTLADTLFKTRFGERRRPHFNVVDWVHMAGGNEPQQAALPAPSPTPVTPTTAAKPSSVTLETIKPVTIAEEMNDEIPFDLSSERKKVVTNYHARGFRRDDLKATVHMIVDDTDLVRGRDSPSAIAEKIAGPEYRFATSMNISQPVPGHVKNRLFVSAEELEELYAAVPELRPRQPGRRARSRTA